MSCYSTDPNCECRQCDPQGVSKRNRSWKEEKSKNKPKEIKMKNTKKIEELQNEIKRLEQEEKAPKKETVASLTEKFEKSQDKLAIAVEALQFMKQFRQLSREVYITATRALEKIEGMK